MIGGKSQGSIQPVALGAAITSSTYGQTIPVVYGRTKQSLYLIWNNGLRTEHDSGKKIKKILSFGIKKGPAYYAQNVDFLLATNPVISPLMLWQNQSTRLPLVTVKYSVSISAGTESITVPDSLFYTVLGVTLTIPYSETFNDYGSPGPVSFSGNFEIPLWNATLAGPDITDMAAYRFWPYVYYWTPRGGPTIFIESCKTGAIAGTFNIYYTELYPSGSTLYSKSPSDPSGSSEPIAALNLEFEPQLGDGGEYVPFPSQQIIYPHYAGIASSALDLGSAQVMPTLQVETQGAHGVYGTGDADFCDMVADIFKGAGQAGFGGTQAYTEVQHGLGCFNFPGLVQKVVNYSTPLIYPPALNDPKTAAYPLPNTAGNFLIVFAACPVGPPVGSTSISDSAGNSWTAALAFNGLYVWYATAKAFGPPNVVTLSGNLAALMIFEVGGVDTLDAVSVSNPGGYFSNADFGLNNQITATGVKGTPMYLLSLTQAWIQLGGLPLNVNSGALIPNVHWNVAMQIPGGLMQVEERTVYTPGTYPFSLRSGSSFPGGIPEGSLGSIANVMFAFKCSQPPSYPRPLTNIFDNVSLELTRTQCRANGLYGSLLMDSQQNASDWLEGIYKAMNAAAVWAGFTLQTIPYSEVSAVGNGAVYIAPTASGPIANLTEDDMIAEGETPPVTVDRKAQVDIPNLLQIQHPNRAGDYNDVIISQPEAGSIALYGPRKDAPQQMRMIQDPTIARQILSVDVKRQNYLRNTYKFKLKAKWKLLLPMDLVTIPVSATMALTNPDQIGDLAIPIRITSIAEDDKYNLDVEAEPFIYGCSNPSALSSTPVAPYQPQVGADPGTVNVPIIFEPVARLCAAPPAQLWIVVSGGSANYGGCIVYLSTDGGSSYNSVGAITGNATTGVLTADWPAHADPDTANNLMLDLTESLGALVSYQTADRDNFVYPCYVAGGGSSSTPYELMTYNSETLTSAFHYTLNATGGGGNELRRAVFGAPVVLQGCDHPMGSRFALLGPQGPGILKLNMDPTWIGKTLKFKFAAYNNQQGALAATTGLTVYSYSPTGIAQPANPAATDYANTPPNDLTNPTSTTIHMGQVSVAFPQNTVNYNARTFTITAPSVPTTYYVTIADPNYLGDTGAGTGLTATCSTSQALCGVIGNTYIGSIVALPAGGGTIVTPGGWPAPQLFLVNGS